MLLLKSLFFYILVSINYVDCDVMLNLEEGQPCFDGPDNGTCVYAYHCWKAQESIAAGESIAICGHDGETPIVCCTDCYYTNAYDYRDHVFNPIFGSRWKFSSRAVNKYTDYLKEVDYPCKARLESFDVWTYEVDDQCFAKTHWNWKSKGPVEILRKPELLHSVVLGYGSEPVQWLCGGSIISETFILTSGNCSEDKQYGPLQWVAMGPLKVDPPAEPWQRYRVKRTVPFPGYRPTSRYHDLGLVEVTEPIKFSSQVAPATIANLDKDTPIAIVAYSALGHGKSLPETLDSVVLDTLPSGRHFRTCLDDFPPQPGIARGFNETYQYCIDTKSKACEGDRGSAILKLDTTGCIQSIVGITSVGRQCRGPENVALYTRIKDYWRWIQGVVWPEPSFSYTNHFERKTKT